MLTGEKIQIRAIWEQDYPTLIELRNSLQLHQDAAVLPTGQGAVAIHHWLTAIAGNPKQMVFAIADKTQNMVGYVQLFNLNTISRFANLSIVLAESNQGQGYGSEAMQLIEQYAKQTFGLRKVIVEVLSKNLRGLAFYEKLGYRNVGEYQGHFFVAGDYQNTNILEKFLDVVANAPAAATTTQATKS